MRVAIAFLHSGGLKAGTPLEIASTPVTAAPPDANARSTRKTRARPEIDSVGGTGNCEGDSGSVPVKRRKNDTPRRTIIINRKKYVGAAKIRPDSRTPRRFPKVRMATNPREIG